MEVDPRFDSWDEAEIRTSLETVGTLNWEWFEFGKDKAARAQELLKLPRLPQEVQSQVGCMPGSHESVALIDRTALSHAHELLVGKWTYDPFVALLDLTSVVGAVIFYDRVVVVGRADLADQVNSLLDVGEVIRAVSLTTLPSVQAGRWRIESMLSGCFDEAFAELQEVTLSCKATGKVPLWLDNLMIAWRQVLPHVPFPAHDGTGLLKLGWSVSPGPRILQAIFDEFPSGFDYSDTEQLQEAILYNDIRGLFYEKVANVLSALLSHDTRRPPVHYVGNCLRTPMLSARARLAESLLQPSAIVENWLQKEWAQKYRHSEFTVHVPFWLNAVLANVNDLADFGTSVRRARDAGSPLRARRRQIEEGLADGNATVMDTMRTALKGAADDFQRSLEQMAKIALESTEVVAKVALPPGPVRELGAAAANFGSKTVDGWLGKLAIRLFRPHVWFVQSFGHKATMVQNSLQKAARIFGFPQVPADKPREFLTRLTAIM